MANTSRVRVWTGRVLSALAVAGLAFSAVMKFMHGPEVVDFFVGKFGYPENTLTTIGVLEAACALLFAIPQTAVLGAVLLTGYLGGAVATHVRVSDAFISPLVIATIAWAGLYLREDRLRALLPFRTRSKTD
jgi:DoxX-like family